MNQRQRAKALRTLRVILLKTKPLDPGEASKYTDFVNAGSFVPQDQSHDEVQITSHQKRIMKQLERSKPAQPTYLNRSTIRNLQFLEKRGLTKPFKWMKLFGEL